MIPEKLRKFMEVEKADYEIISQNDRVIHSSKQMAKAVIVRAGVKPYMVVIPACYELDLKKLADFLDVSSVSVEAEQDFSKFFPDCDSGIVPALGRLYNVPCLIDETMLDGPSVIFQVGRDGEFFKISSYEYWRVAQAEEIGDFRIHSLK